MFKEITIPALAFHLAIIAPAFGDLVPGTGLFEGTLNEFTLMDSVKVKAPIINIKRTRNIMQRRDASCDLVYKKLMGTDVRSITVDELYSATQFCKNEFYQGALKDWRAGDPLFADKIQPFFQEANRLDILSNAWFGDITRVDPGTYTWSLNKFDGIWKWVAQYRTANLIPAVQAFAMPVSDKRANPAVAYGIIKQLFDSQNVIMRAEPAANKAFYVSQDIADGYQEYLKSLGVGDANTIMMFANGVKISSYNSIAIIPEPCWEPILAELHGEAGHSAAMLTLRGNMVFATDKDYGEGEDDKTALMVWYEKRKLSWYYQQFVKAGTQLALPEHVCYAID